MSAKLNLTPEERLEHKRKLKRESYLRARALGKEWASSKKSLEWWFSLPYEERSARQREANAKHRTKNPDESKNSMRTWRRIHGEEEKKRSIEFRRNNKRLAIEYLGGKCVKCGGVFHPDVYDFHHKDGDDKDVCVAKLLGRKFHRIIEELDKCELLCANCHRVEHAEY